MIFSKAKMPTKPGRYWAAHSTSKDPSPFTIVVEIDDDEGFLCVLMVYRDEAATGTIHLDSCLNILWGDEIKKPSVKIRP